jgi:hypothetical protein
MQYKVGDKVVLKHELRSGYPVTPSFGRTVCVDTIRDHEGHRFKIIGIYENMYLAVCECGVQCAKGDLQTGFWIFVDEMVEVEQSRVDRFEEILKD